MLVALCMRRSPYSSRGLSDDGRNGHHGKNINKTTYFALCFPSFSALCFVFAQQCYVFFPSFIRFVPPYSIFGASVFRMLSAYAWDSNMNSRVPLHSFVLSSWLVLANVIVDRRSAAGYSRINCFNFSKSLMPAFLRWMCCMCVCVWRTMCLF